MDSRSHHLAGQMTGAGSAGSKVILLGEHGVVFGRPAFVCGMTNGVTVVATPVAGIASEMTVAAWGLHADTQGAGSDHAALRQLLAALPLEERATRFVATSVIPHSAGLGASAALAAACARAYGDLYQQVFTSEQLFRAIQASEAVFHRTPSGVDAAAVTQPGFWVFEKGRAMHRVEAAALKLLIVHSNAAGQTRKTVAAFAGKMDAEPERSKRRLDAMESLVHDGIAAARKGDHGALGTIMNENHRILQWFGVSTSALDRICELALAAGAFGAKLTGGGGGGCAVVLTDQQRESAVRQAMTKNGFGIVDV